MLFRSSTRPGVREGSRCAVLHISSVHPFDDVRIIYRECAVLRHAGFDVEAAFFDVPEQGEVAGVPLVSLGQRPGSRLWRAVRAVRAAKRLVRERRPRIVHLHDPELLPLARSLKRSGVSVFYDAHEDLPRQIFHKPWIPAWARAPISRLAEAWLPGLLEGTDAVIVAARHIDAGWMTSRPRVLLRNMPVGARRLAAQGGDFDSRQPAAVYAGLLSPTRRLDLAVKAALQAGAEVRLAGRGDTAYIESLVAMSPDRVRFLGNLEPHRLDELLATCRVGLAMLPGSPAYLEAIPSKVFDYLKAGLPFVWSDFPFWRDALDNQLLEYGADPADVDAVASLIQPLLTDRQAWGRARREVQRCALRYPSAEEESAQLIELYQATLEAS